MIFEFLERHIVVIRPAASIIGICFGILNIVVFSDLPEYCEEYGDIHNDTKITTTSSHVLGLNIIFLIEGTTFLWLGVMHLAWILLARVNPIAADEHESKHYIFDVITCAILSIGFWFGGGLAEFALILGFLPRCYNAYWLPITIAVANFTLFSFFGWMIVAAMILAFCLVCAIVIGPFYLGYHILRGLCYPAKYVKVDAENPEITEKTVEMQDVT